MITPDDKVNFVGGTVTKAFEVGDPDSKKMELNFAGDHLFLSGNKGLSKIQTKDGILQPVYTNRADRAGIMLKKNSKNHMLIHQPEANDMYCIDDSNIERERTKGRSEPGPMNETYNHYRHSLDDRYILWRNGPKDLDIYDCEMMRNDETVPDFWTHNGQTSRPIAAISNREVSKALGLSQLNPSTQVLHYIEKDQNYNFVKNSVQATDLFPNMRKLTTMEVSSDGNTAYIAGLEQQGGNEKPKVMAVTFDKNMRVISSCDLTTLDYKRINRMKRIKGEEVLVLGTNKHFSLVDNENMRQLKEIGNVPNVHHADIVDFEMRDKYLYSRGDAETDIKVTEFGHKKVVAPVESISIPPKREAVVAEPKPMVFKQSKYETFKRFKIDCSFINGSFKLNKNHSRK